jgi:hypothetical protein
LHPNASELYAAKIRDLRETLNAPDSRDEAIVILRSLIEEIRLHPEDGELRIELGNLLAFAQDHPENKEPGSTEPGCTKWLVAGARYPLYRNRRLLRRKRLVSAA